ncbi:MAG: hypothetical protein EZS28_015259 [Streblomastix strix]|uniref:Uncharacterized protein n=1 Tax=Streblomastix strix TaxID=222440 RepID=A0A5J4W3R9_9EUKA|nr:MAG: hypothetical protein EZS28_015259 [Streblomastix strix]
MLLTILLAISLVLSNNNKVLRPPPAILHTAILLSVQNAETSLSITHPIKSISQIVFNIDNESSPLSEARSTKVKQSLLVSLNACSFNVSQTVAGAFRTVAEVLVQNCTQSDGYDVTLLDSTHIEKIYINQKSSILIKSGKKIPTIWRSNEDFLGIIVIEQGNLTLENIDEYTKDTIKSNISEMFKGSYSNGGNDTVQYFVDLGEESIISGSITLLPTPKKNILIYIIIGISVGSVVLIAVIIKEKKFFPGK